jgi:iron complex outermembrane receptor protein
MELEETWTSTDPRLTVRYEFGDNSNVYASYSQGFKAGQLPPGNRPLSIVDPESVDAYEIGYKTVGSRIRFDAAAFYYDYQDLQVTAFLSPGSIVRNAASAEIYGADASLTWDLTDTLTLRAGTAYTHGEYQDFDDAVRFVQSPTSGFFSVQTVDASGNVMQRTPEWTGNLDLTYTKPFERGTLQLGGNLYATSEIFFDPVEQFSQDSYQLLNLRATWTTPNDAMSFSVFGTNVTDEVYRNQVQPATGAVQQGYGEPRSVGLQLTFRL